MNGKYMQIKMDYDTIITTFGLPSYLYKSDCSIKAVDWQEFSVDFVPTKTVSAFLWRNPRCDQ